MLISLYWTYANLEVVVAKPLDVFTLFQRAKPRNHLQHYTLTIILCTRESGQYEAETRTPPPIAGWGGPEKNAPSKLLSRPTPPLLRRSVCSWTMSCSYGELETNQLPLYPSFSSQTGILSSFNLRNIYANLSFLTLKAFTDCRAVT